VKSLTHIVLLFLSFVQSGLVGFAQSRTITTYAGLGSPVDGSFAAGQAIGAPISIALDSAGGFYITIIGQNKIYRVAGDGRITKIAGNDTAGYGGDYGPAISAQLFRPTGLALDAAGNLYIADSDNNRVRKVTPDGIISTAAGTGDPGYSGDGGQATFAELKRPLGVAIDISGNLFIADSDNHRIRKVTPGGVISTIAGNGTPGFSGDGGSPTSAQLHHPTSLAIDSAGSVYVADYVNQVIRKITADGLINTVAGTGTQGFSGDGGLATSAQFSYPQGLALDGSGNLFIADSYNFRIRKLASNGVISTVAGVGTQGFSGDGGQATTAQLNLATDVAVDASGNLFIADFANQRVRKVTSAGVISTAAGINEQGFSGDGGQASSGQLYLPTNVAVDPSGNVFIADSNNYRIRKVTPVGIISTAVGTGSPGFSGDGGQAITARIYGPVGVAVDTAGNLFIADYLDQRIRKVSSTGVISTVAGNGLSGFSGDGGPATSAQFNQPWGIAVDATGNLFVADVMNNRVRKITSSGVISTVVGMGMAGFSGDGSEATDAQLKYPAGVALDNAGNLFIADSGNNRIRKVTPDGVISTIAGDGIPDFGGDGGKAIFARLSRPTGVAIDTAGNLFIADHNNNRIREIKPDGTISTVAGNGTSGFSGDGGQAISAQLNYPTGVAVDSVGNLFVADYENNRIRFVTQQYLGISYFPQVAVGNGYSTSYRVTNKGCITASGTLALTNSQGNPLFVKGVLTDSSGNTVLASVGAAFPLLVPAGETVFISATGLTKENPVSIGWGRLEAPEGLLAGTATIEYAAGGKQAIVSFPQAQPLQYAEGPVENDSRQGKQVAYAIANPGTQTITVKLTLMKQDGTVVGDAIPLTLGPGQQIAKYLSQDLAPTDFKGSLILEGQAGASFVGIAILDNQDLLTSIPFVAKNAPVVTK
jgi:trimeric autotransporter adhesin